MHLLRLLLLDGRSLGGVRRQNIWLRTYDAQLTEYQSLLVLRRGNRGNCRITWECCCGKNVILKIIFLWIHRATIDKHGMKIIN